MNTPLIGIEALEKFLKVAFHTGGEIWLKSSHNIFYKGVVVGGQLVEVYATKGEGAKRVPHKAIDNPYDFLRTRSESKEGGAFFIPAKPKGAPVKDCVKVSDLLSCEMDGGSTEDQWERLNYFSKISGLNWGAIVGSGGKSLHGHIVLESPIGIDTRTHWQRLLAVSMLSDPAVTHQHQPMRIPGFFRKEKNREQTLESYSDNRYSHNEIWDGFRKYFEAEGYQFHLSFTTERWSKIREIVANKRGLPPAEQKAEIKRILSLSEEEINPPRPVYSTEKFSYSGDTIPLEFFLPRKLQDYITSGLSAGSEGRNPVAFKLSQILQGLEETLSRLGIKYSGDSYQLVSIFGSRCNPQIEIDSAYKNAQKYPLNIDEEDINQKLGYWEYLNKPKSKSARRNQISEDEWFQRYKLPKLHEGLANVLKRFYRPKQNPQTEAQTPEQTPKQATTINQNCSAIVPYVPQKLSSIKYIPGQLPTAEEWADMGYPKIIFEEGQRRELLAEIYNQGGFQHTLDTTPPGHFKSHDAGQTSLETFGIDPNDKDNKTRIFNLCPDHRNPTTATVEANYVDFPARHPGLVYDDKRKTALGKPHLVRAKNNQTPDIPSNCPENGTFLTVAELGIPVFGGKDSPICQSCPLLSQGCSFLENRRNTLSNERLIRADINSMPTPSHDDILIIDEPGQTIKNTHQITIKIDEILKTVGKLQLRDDDRIFKALRPVLVAVYKGLQTVTTDKHKYGIPHNEVMELMPEIDELNQTIWNLYADDWLKAGNVWGEPIWHYEMIKGEPTATKIIGEKFVAPSLKDLRDECYKILENYAQYINGLQTPEEKQQAIKDNVIPSWMPPLIDCLTGNKRINLSIDNGKVTITKLSKRHRNLIKNAGFSIALDATISKQDYALTLGVNPNEILEIKEVQQPTFNLHVPVVKGLTNGGKQRRESMQDRIKVAVRAIANRHQGQTIGLIDHKSAMENYQDLANELKLGYWHRDTRGSNQFKNIQVLISIGKPTPNLGQMAAEYQTLTGWIVQNPERLTGRYGAWVKRKIQAELIQCIGRPRAHLRPGEELHVYLLTDLDEDTLSAIRLAYPTATVTTEDVYDLAPTAASKGAQTERGIIQALWSSVQSGAVATIGQIAESLGITKGGVSKCLKERLGIGFKAVKKSLLLLLEAINSKSKLSDLPEYALYIASEHLPNLVSDLEAGHITPVDVVTEIITTAKACGDRQFRRILAATAPPILCKLLGSVMRFIPKKLLSELIPISPQLEPA